MSKKLLNELTYDIVGAAIEVHRSLGPGLLESVYHQCLAREFEIRKMSYTSEQQILIKYKGLELDTHLRSDFVVKDAMVVELKAVTKILPIHEAQLMTYMKLLEKPKGILINFHVDHMYKEGQKTYVNELFKELPGE